MTFYVLSFDDKVIATSPDWDQEAHGQNGEGAMTAQVLGGSIWSFIAGQETRNYLNALFFVCRKTNASLSVPYRCDSPDTPRLVQMTVAPFTDGALIVTHEPVEDVALFVGNHAARPDTALVAQCSQCLRIGHDGSWFESFPPVRLGKRNVHYTVCPSCRAVASDIIARPEFASALYN